MQEMRILAYIHLLVSCRFLTLDFVAQSLGIRVDFVARYASRWLATWVA